MTAQNTPVSAPAAVLDADTLAAAELATLLADIKALEKRASELKSHFKDIIEPGTSRLFGNVIIGVSERERLNLDREALVEAFGEETLAPFCSLSAYLQVDVKQATGKK